MNRHVALHTYSCLVSCVTICVVFFAITPLPPQCPRWCEHLAALPETQHWGMRHGTGGAVVGGWPTGCWVYKNGFLRTREWELKSWGETTIHHMSTHHSPYSLGPNITYNWDLGRKATCQLWLVLQKRREFTWVPHDLDGPTKAVLLREQHNWHVLWQSLTYISTILRKRRTLLLKFSVCSTLQLLRKPVGKEW